MQRDASEVRAHLPNTSPRGVVARAASARGRGAAAATLAAALLAWGLGACGGGRHAAGRKAAVDRALTPTTPLGSGRLDALLTLKIGRLQGSHARREAFQLHLRGPFESLGASRLPRFALAVQQRSGPPHAQTLRATATSTGTQLFIGFRGQQFLAPASTVRALRQGFAEAAGQASPQGSSTALGLDPGRWLSHPTVSGSWRIGGVETVHVVSGLDVPRFLADARALSAATAPVGIGTRAGGAEALSAALAGGGAGAVRVARVDLFTGEQDHLLRRLSLRLVLSPAPQTPASRANARRVTITLVLGVSALNKPQSIATPRNPRPLSELFPLLAAHP